MTCSKKCSKYIECLNDYNQYYKINIIKRLGPVLLSDKPIHLFCFKNDFKFKKQLLKKIHLNFGQLENIKYEVIPSVNNTVKILFYNIYNVQKVLNNAKKVKFLKSKGHKNVETYQYYINYFVKHLEKNIIPPEIGIFFGYPIKDVLGYIGHPSLKSSGVDRWEYYGDPRISKEIAKEYHKAEEEIEMYIDVDQYTIDHMVKLIDELI